MDGRIRFAVKSKASARVVGTAACGFFYGPQPIAGALPIDALARSLTELKMDSIRVGGNAACGPRWSLRN
jgi:hypothetical protein